MMIWKKNTPQCSSLESWHTTSCSLRLIVSWTNADFIFVLLLFSHFRIQQIDNVFAGYTLYIYTLYDICDVHCTFRILYTEQPTTNFVVFVSYCCGFLFSSFSIAYCTEYFFSKIFVFLLQRPQILFIVTFRIDIAFPIGYQFMQLFSGLDCFDERNTLYNISEPDDSLVVSFKSHNKTISLGKFFWNYSDDKLRGNGSHERCLNILTRLLVFCKHLSSNICIQTMIKYDHWKLRTED